MIDDASLENLKYLWQLKSKNLQEATRTILLDNFETAWPIENYLACLSEAEASSKDLLAAMNSGLTR